MEQDMPFSLSGTEKRVGLSISKYWLEAVGKKDKVFIVRELGVAKEYRKSITPILIVQAFDRALALGYRATLFWTNVFSKSFNWGIGLGWTPIHFFIEGHLLLMFGSVKYILKLLCNNLSPSKKKPTYKYLPI